MGARYSRQSGYTVSRRATSRPAVRTVKKNVSFGPTAAKYFGIGVVAIIALVMATQRGAGSTDEYAKNKLRKETSQVAADVADLQLEAKRAQALSEMQASAARAGMEPVTEVRYVETGEVAGASTEQP